MSYACIEYRTTVKLNAEEIEEFYCKRQSLEVHRSAKALGAPVSAWLDKCDSSHVECRRSDSANKRISGWPKRLLDLTNYQDSFPGSTVKVIETSGQSPPYCAVSYRWPRKQKTLTPKDLPRLLNGIEIESLSSTIRDACALAKHAGIQYLWVDALCIVQGPGGDWYEEAQRMASIYTNAVFTVSIMGKATLKTTPPIKSFLSKSGRLVASAKDADFDWDHPESIYKLLMNTGNFIARENTALDERGWVFQEKMLSRRMVTLTTSDIFWNCLHHSACGRRPAGLMGDFSPGFRDTDDREFKRLLHQPTLQRSHQDHYWLWRKAVQDYTKRKLSDKRDRFIAINGIITKLGQVLNDNCYLGIWGKDTLRSLIWFVSPDHYEHFKVITTPNHELLPIKAPSWSWMSISGPISYRLWHPYARYLDQRKEELIPLSTIIDIFTKAESLAEFHQFTGSLCFHGSVVDGYVVERSIFIRKPATRRDLVEEGLLASFETPDISAMIRKDETRSFHKKHFHEMVFLKDPRPIGEDRERFLTTKTSISGNRLPAEDIPDKHPTTMETYISQSKPDLFMFGLDGLPLPMVVKCLLLCEANYGTPLTGQYCMVVAQRKRPVWRYNRWEFADASYQRIGLCAIDAQQACVRSPSICGKPHSCLGRMERLTIE